jgi:RimJ/RimL family protein N-acetyltransferase
MEKIGMRLTHSELNSRFFKGEWRDWLEYTITDTEWQKLCHTG